ncbi:bile acid:sodium symporter [Altererythrobacter sp. HHU K3-1]|uniref:Bile acid:sodium symporter n=1 Tax=Qipengyuania atrilutea TaxID=2744473 RepID=A0A850GVZ5_9SPHN|nr:bile acid:sodium symporter [Actirhodobacter atriluteus]
MSFLIRLTRDPMLRLLAIAILLAAFLPASGAAREIVQGAAYAAIFLLFLVNGIRVARGDILAGLQDWRFFVPLTVWVFLIMGGIGVILAQTLSGVLPGLVIIGFIFLGVLPSTVQSATSYSSLAGGNVALSVIAAALLTIVGIIASPALFVAFGGSGAGSLGWDAFRNIAVLLLLPLCIGLLVQDRFRPFVLQYKDAATWLDRIVIALAVYVAMAGAVSEGLWQRVTPTEWLILAAASVIYLAFAHYGAWMLSGALARSPEDRIAFTFAGAQKSAAIGAPLAAILFPAGAAGFIIVPLLLYHLMQLVLAVPLANHLRNRFGEASV